MIRCGKLLARPIPAKHIHCMKLSAASAIVFTSFLISAPAFSQTTVEDWQQRTVVEYPDIGVKDSEQNKRYVAKIKQLQRADPAFFKNPKWPYLVAEQISRAPIIPGLENVTPTAPPSRTNPLVEETPFNNGSNLRKEAVFIAAVELHEKAAKGDIVETEGVITKAFQRVGNPDKFYLKLEPDIICEFSTTKFKESGSKVFDKHLHDSAFSKYTAKVDNGTVSLYTTTTRNKAAESGKLSTSSLSSGLDTNTTQVKVADVLKKGNKITIKGRYDGDWASGIEKGKIILDANILTVE